MTLEHRRPVQLRESGQGPYGQFVVIGSHVMGADEPKALGGASTGPDPFEYVLAGLGACTVMTIRMYANRKDWPLEDVRVTVVQTRDKPAAPGGKPLAVERAVTLVGPLDEEQRAKLMEMADKCPVGRMLEPSVEISTRAA